MKRTVRMVVGLAWLLAAGAAQADKGLEFTRQEIEADLRLETKLTSDAKVRPSEPVHVSALLKNVSPAHTHKVIEPGNGASYGIVEPHVFYTATFTPLDGKPRELKGPIFNGMCGMGDYRWHNRVRDFAPGASFDLGARLPWANAAMDMKRPGRYALRVHYAFNRRGTTEKLPQADAVGELGPMKGSPSFEIVSESVTIDVVRPVEVFVEPRGHVKKGVARRLSDLVHVRLENWRTANLEIQSGNLKVLVHLRKGKVVRKPVAVKASGWITLVPGEGVVVVGSGGIYDEAWAPAADGPLEIAVTVGGYAAGAPRVRSHWVRLDGPLK